MFPYCGEKHGPDEGFHAVVSEHSPEGCVSQDGCRLCSRGCSRVPRAVVQSRVPAVPQGLCAGAGTLPPARLSTQPARGAAQGAAGRRVGGRSPRQGRAGAFCCHSCCLGQGDHSYTAPQNVSKGNLQGERRSRGISFISLGKGKGLEAKF